VKSGRHLDESIRVLSKIIQFVIKQILSRHFAEFWQT
jgi:hypothetical protein